jgi:hypothetical protein
MLTEVSAGGCVDWTRASQSHKGPEGDQLDPDSFRARLSKLTDQELIRFDPGGEAYENEQRTRGPLILCDLPTGCGARVPSQVFPKRDDHPLEQQGTRPLLRLRRFQSESLVPQR